MARRVMAVFLILGVLGAAGCATVEGLGRDISAGARKVNNAL